MDAKALLKERQEMITNVYNFDHNKRVMLGSNSYTWSILDAGYRLNEALYDYDKLEIVARQHHEKYGFDIYTDVQNRNPVRVTALLGGGKTHIDDVKESVYCDDRVLMQPDEYAEFAADTKKFYFTKAFRRSVKKDLTLGELKVAFREWDLWREANTRRNQMLINEYGALLYFCVFPKVPFENLYAQYRGIKGMSMDLRKHREEIIELLNVQYETESRPALLNALENGAGGYFSKIEGGFNGYVAPITYALLGHTILNRKQFEDFYLPHFRPAIDECIKRGVRLYIHAEGSILRFAEYFEDIPKGYILMHLEQDDPIEFRKRLPNIAIAGGMPVTLLRNGTKEECVEYARRLINELGDGFVLDQDKMMSFRQDCTSENLAAVNDFARNYFF